MCSMVLHVAFGTARASSKPAQQGRSAFAAGWEFGYTAQALAMAVCGNCLGTQMTSDHQTMNKWGLVIKAHGSWLV